MACVSDRSALDNRAALLANLHRSQVSWRILPRTVPLHNVVPLVSRRAQKTLRVSRRIVVVLFKVHF